MPFPKPVGLGPNCTRWRLSDLERYEAAALGRQYEPRRSDEEVYLPDIRVAERYDVSRNTPWRWARDEQEGPA